MSAALTRGQIADTMRRAGWPESAIPMGVAVALAESGGKPSALNTANRNGSRDYGLFQINSVHKELLAKYNWEDPTDNARMALQIYRDAGNKWTPWAVYNSGSYRKFYTGKAPTNDSSNAVADAGGDGTIFDDFREKNADYVEEMKANMFLGDNPLSLGFIGTTQFWQRFGLGVLAVALVIAGLIIVFRRPVASAVNLIPAGKAATLAKGLVK